MPPNMKRENIPHNIEARGKFVPVQKVITLIRTFDFEVNIFFSIITLLKAWKIAEVGDKLQTCKIFLHL